MGRPSSFTKEIGDYICNEMAKGRSARDVLSDKGMPNRETLYSWVLKDEVFANQYARACRLRREERFDALENIVDTEQDVQRARLKIDVIKWQLSKEEPKKYGDKQIISGDADAPLQVISNVPMHFKKEDE